MTHKLKKKKKEKTVEEELGIKEMDTIKRGWELCQCNHEILNKIKTKGSTPRGEEECTRGCLFFFFFLIVCAVWFGFPIGQLGGWLKCVGGDRQQAFITNLTNPNHTHA